MFKLVIREQRQEMRSRSQQAKGKVQKESKLQKLEGDTKSHGEERERHRL